MTFGEEIEDDESFLVDGPGWFVEERDQLSMGHGGYSTYREADAIADEMTVKAWDNDFVPAFSEEKRGTYTFSGKRRKRGFYRASDGRFIHADVNAALNLLRKSNCRFTYVDAAGRGTVVVPWGVPALWRPRGRRGGHRPLERAS